jgi:hypothetical protein
MNPKTPLHASSLENGLNGFKFGTLQVTTYYLQLMKPKIVLPKPTPINHHQWSYQGQLNSLSQFSASICHMVPLRNGPREKSPLHLNCTSNFHLTNMPNLHPNLNDLACILNHWVTLSLLNLYIIYFSDGKVQTPFHLAAMTRHSSYL